MEEESNPAATPWQLLGQGWRSPQDLSAATPGFSVSVTQQCTVYVQEDYTKQTRAPAELQASCQTHIDQIQGSLKKPCLHLEGHPARFQLTALPCGWLSSRS